MSQRTVPILGVLLLGAGVGLALWVSGCSSRQPEPPPAEQVPVESPGLPWYIDVTSTAGISFTHFDSASPMYYIPETTAGGCGWIDYDNDGWIDLLCIQDGPVRPEERIGPQPTHHFYRNNRDGTFTEIAAQVGLNKSGYGMGCAVGDYDNDGFDDIVITYLEGTSLFHNVPDGKGGRRFEDVTKTSKILNPHWGTSCAWGDIDGDGFLDLYVCNYAVIDLKNYKTCENPNVNKLDICPPTIFPPERHKLFRNNGNGTFTDISESSGIGGVQGYGFAVGMIDLDDDGKLDMYVANDMKPAFLFHNLGNGKFEEKALFSGAGMMSGGRFMAGMGVAVGDIDGSHRPSLLVSNYQDEPTMVFLNRGKLNFQEWQHQSTLGPATQRTLGFGIDLLDADLDGNLDVAIANGHVIKNAPDFAKAPYRQQSQIFLGNGKATFREVSDTAGSFFREKCVARGVAVGDYDNDGRPDLVFSLNGGPLKLLRNQTATPNHWSRLELQGDGVKSNRNAVGAKIEIEAGGRKLTRWIHGGGSYLSAADRRVLVGLGSADKVDRIIVVWPSGRRQEYSPLAADRAWLLKEGEAAVHR